MVPSRKKKASPTVARVDDDGWNPVLVPAVMDPAYPEAPDRHGTFGYFPRITR